MANCDDNLYKDGSYYVEDEFVEEYVVEHVQDPRTMFGSQPPIMISNNKILDTLHCIDQKLQEYLIRMETMESRMDRMRYHRNTLLSRNRGRGEDGCFRQVTPEG